MLRSSVNSTLPTILISCIIAYMLRRVQQILSQFGGFDTDDEERKSEDLLPAKSYLERARQATARRPMSPGAGGRSPGRRRGLSFSQLRARARTMSGPRSPSPALIRALGRGRCGPHPADAKRKRAPRWGGGAAPPAAAAPPQAQAAGARSEQI